MITQKSRFDPPASFILPEGCHPETSIFFDIETTGFRPEHSQVYLIGALYYSGKEWHTIQWMSENTGEESALLRVFDAFLRPYRDIIHFNGDRFDIPYLRARYRACCLADPFEAQSLNTHDLFRKIRTLKKLLSLEHCSQKSLECFLGLSRKDPFHGGELIRVYQNYCTHPDDSLLSSLLLHNREDLTGMLSLTALLAYVPLVFSPEDSPVIRNTVQARLLPENPDDPENSENLPRELQIRFQLPDEIPAALIRRTDFCRLSAAGNEVLLTVPVYHGKLKHYFPNSQDYYYLPAEDQAIHKSVAVFVDPSHRVKATADTCYICREGLFLPQQNGHRFSPVFYRDRKDSVSFFPLPEDIRDPSFLIGYVCALLPQFCG